MTMALTAEIVAKELEAVDRLFHDELTTDLRCVNTLVRHVARFRGEDAPADAGPADRQGRQCRRATFRRTPSRWPPWWKWSTWPRWCMTTCWTRPSCGERGATINHLRGNEGRRHARRLSHQPQLSPVRQSRQPVRQPVDRPGPPTRFAKGELLQIDNRHNLELDEETYTRIITRKTAVLCQACCTLGATYAGATPHVVEELGEYGRCLGIAFQNPR